MSTAEAAEHLTRVVEAPTEVGALDQLTEALLRLTGSASVVGVLLGSDGTPSHVSHDGLPSQQVEEALGCAPSAAAQRVLGGEVLRFDRPDDILGAGRRQVRRALIGPWMAVPLRVENDVLGAVFVARAPRGPAYLDSDERIAVAVARTAAVVVRRLRLVGAARTLNGSLTTRPDAALGERPIRRLLQATRELLDSDVACISEIDSGIQAFRFIDGAADLRSLEGQSVDLADSPCGLMLSRRIPPSVPDLGLNALTAPLPVREMGFNSYCGVPLYLPGRTTFGSLCTLDREARPSPPTSTQIYSLRVLADLIGAEIAARREAAELQLHEQELFTHQIATDRRQVFFQPIVDLRSGRRVGHEALARFRDVVDGFRRPDLVFAEAAQYGLQLSLEEDMVRRALGSLATLPADTFVSVNLSPEALVTPDVVRVLRDALERYPDRIVIELTEHEVVVDYSHLLRTVRRLREVGARLAIDDVGAGYSSLQHASRLDPDIIKLDAAFVRDIDTDATRRAIARAIASLCAEVGSVMVAEGIETEAELHQVVELGGTLGQGFLLGRPAPLAEVV